MQGRLVHPLLITTLFLVNTCLCQTPVIGGTCRLGTADVQIGGKQTQFFLKCEATSDSAAGEGVWVVKSRAAAAASTSSTVGTTTSSFTVNQAIPVENTQPQQHPKLMRKQGAPNICEQDLGARESDSCAVSATCLQAATDVPSSYLQCDQSSLRWVRKSCQDGFVFNFEQQTCIVPKRMSSLSHACTDGSVAVGRCPCPQGTFCTSHKLCCPIPSKSCSTPCLPHCPSGMACDTFTNCCRTMNGLHKMLKLLLNGHEGRNGTKMRRAIGSRATTFSSASLSSSSSSKVSTPCDMPNASCADSSECPPTFTCFNKCCRLEVCPNGSKVLFTCTNIYQCRSGETCLFGGCCRLKRAKSSSESSEKQNKITDVAVDLQVIQDPYKAQEQQLLESTYSEGIQSVLTKMSANVLPPTKKITSQGPHMPAFAPTDDCLLDNRVRSCSLSNPCPEISECMDGQCCRLEEKRCRNGLRPLMLPRMCRKSDECPIASFCEDSSCCPLDSNFMDQPMNTKKALFSNEKSLMKKSKNVTSHVDSNSGVRKLQCLMNQGCLMGALCPLGFTCTLDGRCCQLPASCPDGSIPEAMCGGMAMCPSPMHVCYTLGERMNICCMRGDSPIESACPPGSVEVSPRFGDSCRYSLQCPSPYFCNGHGRCCLPLF